MDQIIQGHGDRNRSPQRLRIEPDESPTVLHLDTLDRTLQQCLLETQRQVSRLEAIVRRLSSIASWAPETPVGALALIEESNRRLQREVTEFSLDSQAVIKIVRKPAPPPSSGVLRHSR